MQEWSHVPSRPLSLAVYHMNDTGQFTKGLKFTGEPLLINIVRKMSHKEVLLSRIVKVVSLRVFHLLSSRCGLSLSFALVGLWGWLLFLFFTLVGVIRIVRIVLGVFAVVFTVIILILRILLVSLAL